MNANWHNESFPNPAGFLVRALAYILDSIVIIVPVAILQWVLLKYGRIQTPGYLSTLIMFLYSFVCHWRFGATFGKKQSEIRVETKDGGKISFMQSLKREYLNLFTFIVSIGLSFVDFGGAESEKIEYINSTIRIDFKNEIWHSILDSFLALIFIVDVIWIVFISQKRALHDIISGTYCRIK